MRRRRRTARGTGLVTLILVAMLGWLVVAMPIGAQAESHPPNTTAATAQQPTFADAPPRPDIVVIGAPGLRWSDLRGAVPTPGLWLMARESALAALAVRTVKPTACPLDGWLTLNAGVRAIGPRPDGRCLTPPTPDGVGRTASIPGWDALVAPNDEHSYDPGWGVLAGVGPADPDAIGPHLRCAVGPGAAIALADTAGRVRATYAERLRDLPARGCSQLLVLDAGALPAGADRAERLRALDRLVAAVRAALPGSAVMLAGLGDSDPGQAHLSALLVESGRRALQGLRRGWLEAESTRQPGLVTITDLTPTLIRGQVPEELDGTRIRSTARVQSTPAAVRDLDRLDVAAQVISDVFVFAFVVLIAGQVLVYAVLAWLWRRQRLRRVSIARAVRATALGAAAVPAAALLINLLPWQAHAHPAVMWWVGVLGAAVLLAAIAALGPWRRDPYGPPVVVAVVTTLAFTLDAVNGSGLAINSLFGLSPLIAGRFYGFGNIAFGVFAACALVAAAGAAIACHRRSRPGLAGAAAAGVGVVAVLVDGWPDWGADLGGMLALAPAVAFLSARAAGLPITAPRVAAVLAATVAMVAAVAVWDWRRPEQRRSHLGRFVQDVRQGEGPAVIGRKLEANLGLLVDAPVIVPVALAVAALMAVLVLQPQRLGLGAFAAAQRADPLLRPLLLACLGAGVLGFASNDSGVIVPAVCLVTAAPLIVAIWVGMWSRPPARRP